MRAELSCTVKYHMLVHFIADAIQIMLQHQLLQRQPVGLAKHHAGWIMRAVNNNEFSTCSDRFCHLLPVDTIARRLQRNVHSGSAAQVNCRLIAVICRVKHNHFISGLHHSADGNKQCFRCATGNGDIQLRTDIALVAALYQHGDLFTQLSNTRHRRVLVQTLPAIFSQFIQ